MKTITTGVVGSILASILLLSGCGSNATTEVKAPKDTIKLIRGVAADATDWTWFVGTDGRQDANSVTLTSYFMEGLPKEATHFQYFLDTDNNPNTGFSFGQDSWKISGADILVEDGAIYTSQSKTAWKWSYVGTLDNYTYDRVEGIEQQINFTGNKTLLGITSDTIHVTIELFDADWKSSYSTISTQEVKLEKGDVVEMPDPALTQELLPAGVSIEKFLVTPDHKGAIVLTKGMPENIVMQTERFIFKTILYVDYSDINHPQFDEKDIATENYACDIVAVAMFYSDTLKLNILDNKKISYDIKHENGGTYKILYDFRAHTTLAALPTNKKGAIERAKQALYKTLPNPNYFPYSSLNRATQLTETTWKIPLRINRSGNNIQNPLPDLIVTVVYDALTDRIDVLSKQEDIAD